MRIEEVDAPRWAMSTGGDVLATVETDKALVDVEAEASGVLLRTLVPAGAQVEIGTPVALLGAPGEQPADLSGRVGVAVPERRALDVRPQPDPVRRHHQQPPVVLQHAPDLAQHPPGVLRRLQPVHE